MLYSQCCGQAADTPADFVHQLCSICGNPTQYVTEQTLEALENDDDKEYDDNYCPSCNGSGEGMSDGSRCHRCKGSGHAVN